MMSNDKDSSTSSSSKEISSNKSNISEIKPKEEHRPNEVENYQISKDTIPSFKKILVTDDGKDISHIALNYAVALSNSAVTRIFLKEGMVSFEI